MGRSGGIPPGVTSSMEGLHLRHRLVTSVNYPRNISHHQELPALSGDWFLSLALRRRNRTGAGSRSPVRPCTGSAGEIPGGSGTVIIPEVFFRRGSHVRCRAAGFLLARFPASFLFPGKHPGNRRDQHNAASIRFCQHQPLDPEEPHGAVRGPEPELAGYAGRMLR